MIALDRSPELNLAMKMMASMEEEMPIKDFLVLALVAILFSGAKPF